MRGISGPFVETIIKFNLQRSHKRVSALQWSRVENPLDCWYPAGRVASTTGRCNRPLSATPRTTLDLRGSYCARYAWRGLPDGITYGEGVWADFILGGESVWDNEGTGEDIAWILWGVMVTTAGLWGQRKKIVVFRFPDRHYVFAPTLNCSDP